MLCDMQCTIHVYDDVNLPYRFFVCLLLTKLLMIVVIKLGPHTAHKPAATVTERSPACWLLYSAGKRVLGSVGLLWDYIVLVGKTQPGSAEKLADSHVIICCRHTENRLFTATAHYY